MRILRTAMILYLLIEAFYLYPVAVRLRARSRCNSL
jgi:hypothetical protein